jgi:hypothetical protein
VAVQDGDRLLADHLYKLDLPDSEGFGKNLRQVDAISRIKGLRLNRYSRRYFQPGDKFESPWGRHLLRSKIQELHRLQVFFLPTVIFDLTLYLTLRIEKPARAHRSG